MEIGVGDLLVLINKAGGGVAPFAAVLFAWLWWRAEHRLEKVLERERQEAAEYASSVNRLVTVVHWLRFTMMQGHMLQYDVDDVQDLLSDSPKLLRERE